MSFSEKIKKIVFDNRFILLSAGCSAAIMLVIFMCFGLFPLGDTTILRMDLYHQYGPLFAELYDRITSGGSFFYSFNTGLGSSFLGNYFNYLSSPVGIIVALVAGHKNIPEAIAVMVLIKAALSALTMTLFFKKSQGRSNYISAGFGVLYSLCGWFIAYYWNVMWVDAMVLLPLVALGIERIIKNGKPLLYIAALALTMFSNYYMSYMMCVFAVVYFITYFISNYSITDSLPIEKERHNKKDKKYNRFLRSGFMFAFSSICAAGLMAFALLPTFLTLQQTSATSGTFPTDTKFYFSVFDFISNHLASVTPTIRSSGDDVMPNVYCGILTLMLIPLYLLTKTISKKEKAIHLALLAFFTVGFNYNVLNYIWHGFHYPNDLPYRQSFMYSFILVLIAFKTFSRLSEIPNRYILFSAGGIVALSIMAQELESKNVTDVSLIVSIVFAAIYALALVTLKDKKFQTISVSVLLLCCMCSEAIIADTSNFSMDQKKVNYAGDYDNFRDVKDHLDEINDEPFYRMELTKLRARMDPSWYNYNGISTFSSMAYEKVSNLQKSLGMYSNKINSYTYYPQTAVYNAMFSLKYLVNNTSEFDVLSDSDYMTSVYQNDIFTAYKNERYLPVGFCTDTALANWNTTSSDPFDVQNDLFEKATGVSDVLIRTFPSNVSYTNVKSFTQPLTNQIFSYSRNDNSQNGQVSFDFRSEADAEVYLYVSTTDENNEVMTVMTETQNITETLNKHYSYILNIGQLKKNEQFTCSIPVNSDTGTIYIYACYLNNNAFEEGFKKLKHGAMIYDKFTDTDIEGSFFADETSIFMTSIPYDNGWNVYIDGEKVSKSDIVKVGDSLLGVYVSQGYHQIKLKFTPSGFGAGVIISLSTVLICAIVFIINIIRKKTFHKVNRFDPIDNSFDTDPFVPFIADEKMISIHETKKLPECEIIRPSGLTEEELEKILETDEEKEELKTIKDNEFNQFFSQE